LFGPRQTDCGSLLLAHLRHPLSFAKPKEINNNSFLRTVSESLTLPTSTCPHLSLAFDLPIQRQQIFEPRICSPKRICDAAIVIGGIVVVSVVDSRLSSSGQKETKKGPGPRWTRVTTAYFLFEPFHQSTTCESLFFLTAVNNTLPNPIIEIASPNSTAMVAGASHW
jgi:hypothetical protein